MNRERYQRVQQLFLEACRLDAGDRDAFLDRACVDDEELRRLVAGMLEQDVAPGADLESGAIEQRIQHESCRREAADEPMPAQIGGYRILGILSEGGMGRVYRAEQSDPPRQVALKVIRASVPSRSVLRRFEHEVRMLARLQHPGIAQIYEASTTDLGDGQQPYFAMELVDGVPLTEFAESRALTTQQRLTLFLDVCQAVHHAHTKGVIHRDLKPANILVAEDAGASGRQGVEGSAGGGIEPRKTRVLDASTSRSLAGFPKILDFGIARTADSDTRVTTMGTDVNQLLGTIPYMSPEQVAGSSADVDARSDVYALGVVLYELLAGRTPHDHRGKSIPESVRTICEDDPVRLSSVSREFRGDLETIVRKTLEKEAERRYQSAHELAADIGAYLERRPILARPPSATYQLRRFTARNKTVVGSMIGIMLALAIAAAVSVAFGMQAGRRGEEAREALEVARAVNDFLNDDLLRMSSPLEHPDRDVRLREVLDRASVRVQDRFHDHPRVRLELLLTLGTTYGELGEYDKAEAHLRESLALAREHLGPRHPTTLAAAEHGAMALAQLDRLEEAETLARETVGLLEATAGVDDEKTVRARATLANVLLRRSRLDEAERIVKTELARVLEVAGTDHNVATLLMTLQAELARLRGNWDEAIGMTRLVLERKERVHGAESAQAVDARQEYAKALRAAGRLDESIDLLQGGIALGERIHDVDHPIVLRMRHELAEMFRELHRLERAEDITRDLLVRSERALGVDHSITISTKALLASVLIDQGQPEEAAPLSMEVLRWRRSRYGDLDLRTLTSMNNLATLHLRQDELEEAVPLLEQAIAGFRRELGASHPSTLGAVYNLATVYERLDRFEAAREHYEHLVAVGRRRPSENNWRLGGFLGGLGRCYTRAERYEEAQAVLLEADDVMRAAFDQPNAWTVSIAESLAELYEAWDQPRRAGEYRRRLGAHDPAPTVGRP